jgi:hypothetical protein
MRREETKGESREKRKQEE